MSSVSLEVTFFKRCSSFQTGMRVLRVAGNIGKTRGGNVVGSMIEANVRIRINVKNWLWVVQRSRWTNS